MKTKLFKNSMLVVLSFALLFLTSCAESVAVQDCLEGEPYGFWNGLWHGIIAPVTFVISLFKENVAIYGVNNNGGWYDFGFMFGLLCISGGSGKASCKSKKRKG